MSTSPMPDFIGIMSEVFAEMDRKAGEPWHGPINKPKGEIIVIPESRWLEQSRWYRDEIERQYITFDELYAVLDHGWPGQYILQGA